MKPVVDGHIFYRESQFGPCYVLVTTESEVMQQLEAQDRVQAKRSSSGTRLCLRWNRLNVITSEQQIPITRQLHLASYSKEMFLERPSILSGEGSAAL